MFQSHIYPFSALAVLTVTCLRLPLCESPFCSAPSPRWVTSSFRTVFSLPFLRFVPLSVFIYLPAPIIWKPTTAELLSSSTSKYSTPPIPGQFMGIIFYQLVPERCTHARPEL